MVITQPTIDDFSDTTVMRVIRKIVNYICSDSGLVAQINDNDITGFTSSYKDNVLKIDATKGDGSKLPVCNVTIEGGGSSTGNPYPTAVSGTVGVDGNIKFTITMSSGNPITTTINMSYFASAADLSDLQEQVTKIKPTVTTNLESSPPTITISVNGSSSTAKLPSTSGSSEWENIDLSNIPTDFKEGDYLIITFKEFNVSISSPSNWNTEPNTATYDQIEPGTNIGTSCIIRISSTTTNDPRVPLQVRGSPSTGGNFTGLKIFTIDGVGLISAWNNPNYPSHIISLRMYHFNGGGAKFTEFGITRQKLSNWIVSMYRIRV